jgi:hypothetical protein
MSELKPEWISAIGTVLAVIVAIVLSVSSLIAKWWNRPRFKVEFKNEEPYSRTTKFPSYLAYWIRLRVLNVGRSVAKDCEGKLVKIIDAQTKEELRNFDPVVLHWVGARIDKPIDINKNEYEYLDIINTQSNDPNRFYIRGVGLKEDIRGINPNPERRDYFLHIEIYGANIDPQFVEVELKNHRDFDKIRASIHDKSSVKRCSS